LLLKVIAQSIYKFPNQLVPNSYTSGIYTFIIYKTCTYIPTIWAIPTVSQCPKASFLRICWLLDSQTNNYTISFPN